MDQPSTSQSAANLGGETPPIAVVIPAGGSGTRLWPRSRRSNPKQLLDIVSPGKSMIQETVERISPSFSKPDHVYVITNSSYADQVREQLPDTPARNIIGEPIGRDSGPAIALMTALLENDLGGDAIMIVLSADHAITDIPAFHNCLYTAIEGAKLGYLVTLGIDATEPDTGFGYIHRGEQIETKRGIAFEVMEFREKPNRETALRYVESGQYSWNAGIFVCKISVLRELFKLHAPDIEQFTSVIVESYDTPSRDQVMAEIFPNMPRISVDFAVVEKAKKVAVVPATIGWSDVGSWARLAEVLADTADQSGNVLFGHDHQILGATDSLIYSPNKMVAVIGIDDLIIVDTPDAILVATKDRAEDVKTIVENLQKQGRQELI